MLEISVLGWHARLRFQFCRRWALAQVCKTGREIAGAGLSRILAQVCPNRWQVCRAAHMYLGMLSLAAPAASNKASIVVSAREAAGSCSAGRRSQTLRGELEHSAEMEQAQN